MGKNTLVIVGTGIKFMSHLTIEAKSFIERADTVLYLVNEPATKEWIKSSNKSTESLDFIYTKNHSRDENYKLISEYVTNRLQHTKLLCLVIYGHPTVLAKPGIYSRGAAIQNGYNVIVLPGISSEDCLFADLGIDPGSCGCQSFESTDFLVYNRDYDPSSHLILWQPGIIGLTNVSKEYNPAKGLTILADHLNRKYDLSHELTLYEASQYPGFMPNIKKIKLRELPKTEMSRISTLYIPPNVKKVPDPRLSAKLKSID